MRRLVRPGLAGWHRRLAAVASARARTGVIEVLPHVRASSGFVVAMVALTTCAGWLLAMLSGHGAIVTSYWLCLPVVIAAGRFGRPGAFVAAVGASLGAGPLTMLAPSGDGSGKAEPLVWFMGAVFFVIVGQVVTGLLRRVHQADSRIAGAMNEQRDRAVDALAERDVLSQRLAHQATHDPVTGLPNRLLFLQRLEDTLLHSAPTQSVGVLFIDLDDFKTVNDSLGHAAGDELLMGVAQRLQNAIRGGDVVARFGGDEFAVLLHQGTAENASGLANRLLGVLRTPFALAAGMASGQASGGLVLACRDGQQPIAEQAADLLRRADLAMYAAKAAGGGRCVEFRDEFHDAMLERLSLRDDIVAAQIREEFYLHYQPVIDLRTRRVVAVEALLRWTHPVRGEISPVRFIPIAEESGAIVQLGLWVLEQACADLQRWDELCPGNGVSITVNLSARQLRESSVGAQIARVLHHAGVDPRRLILEITESLVMDDSEAATATLWQLRALGIRIAVDDFGTGYSSLSRLVDLPLDDLKIDRSFIAELEHSEAGATIVQASIAMAHGLNLTVIAEGVENLDQLSFLEAAGCDHVQGHLFSAAIPAEVVAALLRDGSAMRAGPHRIPAARDGRAGARSARPSRAVIPAAPRHR